jgi:hypothetical protein
MAEIYRNAAGKDAQFDDPATAAYQIELGIEQMRRLIPGRLGQTQPNRIPPLLQEIDWEDFWRFYGELSDWIYALGGRDERPPPI